MLQRITDRLDVPIAVMLGIAAVAAAFAGYHAGDQGDKATQGLTGGAASANLAFNQVAQGIQQRSRDSELFLEYAKAFEAGDTAVSRFIRVQLMDGNLRAGLRDYERRPETDPMNSPLESPEYKEEFIDEAQELSTGAVEAIEEAERADERSGEYDVVVVILSVALFFLGLAGVTRRPIIRVGVAGVGTVVLAVSLAMLGVAHL
jgi:hypothetical protein